MTYAAFTTMCACACKHHVSYDLACLLFCNIQMLLGMHYYGVAACDASSSASMARNTTANPDYNAFWEAQQSACMPPFKRLLKTSTHACTGQ
jgi:hypothetical protein